ncbi:hypothetical protein DFQ13_104540 [Actinokineospora spheciospongiae]|nr:hypothetical protein DFQ13_104540 [Actinokineospora spheciospongiae]
MLNVVDHRRGLRCNGSVRTLSRLLVPSLITAGVVTLSAIAVNVWTSESVPAPFHLLKAHAHWAVLGLWLLTALLAALYELPRRKAAEEEQALAEQDRLGATVAVVRGRMHRTVARRVRDSRLFPGLPRLPQVWQSATPTRLATDAAGYLRGEEYVRTFEAVPSRRLVVCGAAGTGKTDWLLTYAQGALAADGPVPLLLDLSTWPRDLDFERWTGRQFAAEFPELDGDFVHTGRFVLLLDGLDEVDPERRHGLLEVLGSAVWSDQAIILTSRPEAYPDHGLLDAAVIILLPLDTGQVVGWLDRVFRTEADAERWLPVRRALRTPGSPVAEALSSPLMVTLAAKVFQDPGSDPAELADAGSVTGRLLDGVVPAAYARPGKQSKWTAEQAAGWLEFLATHTGRDGIAWWRLYLLVPRWRFAVCFGFLPALTGTLIAGGAAWLFLGALPAGLSVDDTWELLRQPLLIAQSMFDNAVRTISGEQQPSAAETAVAVGSAVGSIAAGCLSGALLGARESSWWRRTGWSIRGIGRPWPTPVRDIGFGVVVAAAAGALTATAGVAVASLLLTAGEDSSALFWLATGTAVRVGALTGAGTGLYSVLFGEPPLVWSRLSPSAPSRLRLTLPPWRRWVLAAAGGAVAGTVLALAFGAGPGRVALLCAAVAVAGVAWLIADDLTDDEGPGPADTWQALGAERPSVLLRDDVLASLMRVVATALLAAPLLAAPFVVHPAVGRTVAGLLVVYAVLRELTTRSWSWWLVAALALAVRRRLPWSALGFLEDARARQVLRVQGGRYHFRHAELADRLSRAPAPPAPAPRREDWDHVVVDAPYAEDLIRAYDLIDEGEDAKARPLLEALRDRARRDGDAEAALVARAALAQLPDLDGAAAGLRRRLTEILPEVLATFGEAHLLTVRTRLLLADLLTGDKAIRHVDAVLAARPHSAAPSDPYVRAAHLRGVDLHEDGDQLSRLHHAAMAEAGLPEGDPRVERLRGIQLEARTNVVCAFAPAPERLVSLTRLHREACARLRPGHPTTMTIRVELAKACGRAGRWAQAEEHWVAITEWADGALEPGPVMDGFHDQLRKARGHRRF